MFQFAFVAELFRFIARRPPFAPLLQLQNRRVTQTKEQGNTSAPKLHLYVYTGEVSPDPSETGGNRSKDEPMAQFAYVAEKYRFIARRPPVAP